MASGKGPYIYSLAALWKESWDQQKTVEQRESYLRAILKNTEMNLRYIVDQEDWTPEKETK